MIYLLVYFVFSLLSLFMIFKLYRVRHSEVGLLLAVVSGLTSFWLFLEGISYFKFSEQAIIFFQRLKYVSIIPITPLLVIISYGMIWNYTSKNKKRLALLFIIPVISLLSLMTNAIPYVFVSNEAAYIKEGILIYSYTREAGFYVHILYSYLLLLINGMLLLFRALKAPNIYRTQSVLLFLGATITSLLNVFFIFGVFGTISIDTTPVSIFLTLVIYYWIAFVLPKKIVVLQARNLMIDSITDIMLTIDNNGKIIDMNAAARKLTMQTSNLFSGKIDTIDFTGVNFSKFVKSLSFINDIKGNTAEIKEGINEYEIVINGDVLFFDLIVKDLLDSENKKIGLTYILRDVSQTKKNYNNLMQLNDQLKISDRVINEALEGIVITDKDNKIIRVNNSYVSLTGYEFYELLGNNPSIVKSGYHDSEFYEHLWYSLEADGHWDGEIWNQKKTGEQYPVRLSINTIRDENNRITNYIGILSDISEAKKAEEELRYLAYYDSLTGLPNRSFFHTRLNSVLESSENEGKRFGLMYIDLDKFKKINDTLGHSVGDELLIQVASRFKVCVENKKEAFRLGGDEFGIILEDIEEGIDKELLPSCMLKAFEEPFEVNGKVTRVSISIGMAIYPEDDTNAEDLMRKADLALHAAKEKGKNRFEYYVEAMGEENSSLHELEDSLVRGINNQEFELYLQPQVSIINGVETIIGAEALIRWPQPDGTMISPYKFIGLAEKNGMIFDIGQIVLKEVVKIYSLLVEHDIDINLSFNASGKQFENSDFLNLLKELALSSETELNLIMEITESLLLESVDDVIRMLMEIKQLGLKIALDDFGTGYSSLSYLGKLPIDYLKIDKSFIDEMDIDENNSITHMIISMAKMMDLKVVAEGVESKDQVENLYRSDCDTIQGYYYSKPLPISEFINYFKDFNN